MGVIVGGAGAALANSSASGGKVYAYNNISDAGLVQVAPANPQRIKLTIHNPSDTDVYISPQYVLNAAGSNVALTPTNAALGGAFLVYANGGTLTITGECSGAWYALGKTGAANKALTVMDSNL